MKNRTNFRRRIVGTIAAVVVGVTGAGVTSAALAAPAAAAGSHSITKHVERSYVNGI